MFRLIKSPASVGLPCRSSAECTLRNRINSTRMIWMASQNSFECQQQPAERTMAHDCLIGILRTARMETTCCSQHRRQCVLVCPDQSNENDLKKFINDHHISKSGRKYSLMIGKPFQQKCLRFAIWR